MNNLNIFIEDYIDYLNNGKTKEEKLMGLANIIEVFLSNFFYPAL